MNRNDIRRLEVLEKGAGKSTAQQDEAWAVFVNILDDAARAKARGDGALAAELNLFVNGGCCHEPQ